MNVFAPWQQRAYDQAVTALDNGRLSHGLLVPPAPRRRWGR